MQIDDALLDKLQKMAMLEVDENKREEVKAQLSEILNFVENLSSIQTEEIKDTCKKGTPLREDEIKDQQIYQVVLQHAPCAKDGYFVVPKILE